MTDDEKLTHVQADSRNVLAMLLGTLSCEISGWNEALNTALDDPAFKAALDERGRDDVYDSPGEWPSAARVLLAGTEIAEVARDVQVWFGPQSLGSFLAARGYDHYEIADVQNDAELLLLLDAASRARRDRGT
jgi:hypothetical protein